MDTNPNLNSPQLLKSLEPTYSLNEIAALRDLFQSLSKGVKASRQYPNDHPTPVQFKGFFLEKLRSFFELSESVAVSVNYESLTVGEETILKSAAGADNIAHVLHRDGVRYLELSANTTSEEASKFFDAFVVCTNREEGEEDIVNLFWQAEFQHIKYVVVDVFEASEVKELYLDINAENDPIDIELEKVIGNSLTDETSPESTGVRNKKESEADAANPTPHYSDIITDFTVEESLKLAEMMNLDRQTDLKNQVIELLLQLAGTFDSIGDLTICIEALQSAFDKSIRDGNLNKPTMIIRSVKKTLQSDQVTVPVTRKKLEEFLDRSGDKPRIKMVTDTLNRHEEFDVAPVKEYLSELGWESLNNLLWMLGELSYFPARKMLCDLLVEMSRDKIDLLGGAVFDSRWYLVRNVVWVLGETGSDRAISFLRKAIVHTEMRVRTEAIKALTKIGSNSAIETLVICLKDESERIRSMAAQELGNSRSQTAFEGLEKIVNLKEFPDAPDQEMRQIFESLVLCGGVRAVRKIEEIVDRSSLLNKARLRRFQEAAVSALQHSDCHEGIQLLTRLVYDSKTHLIPPARKALASIQARQENQTSEQ